MNRSLSLVCGFAVAMVMVGAAFADNIALRSAGGSSFLDAAGVNPGLLSASPGAGDQWLYFEDPDTTQFHYGGATAAVGFGTYSDNQRVVRAWHAPMTLDATNSVIVNIPATANEVPQIVDELNILTIESLLNGSWSTVQSGTAVVIGENSYDLGAITTEALSFNIDGPSDLQTLRNAGGFLATIGVSDIVINGTGTAVDLNRITGNVSVEMTPASVGNNSIHPGSCGNGRVDCVNDGDIDTEAWFDWGNPATGVERARMTQTFDTTATIQEIWIQPQEYFAIDTTAVTDIEYMDTSGAWQPLVSNGHTGVDSGRPQWPGYGGHILPTPVEADAVRASMFARHGNGATNISEFVIFGSGGGSELACDFDNSTTCDDADIDLLAAAVRNGTSDSQFNVDGQGDPNIPDDADFVFYITDDSMLSTGLGDSDLNMIVNFVDFVKLSNDFGNTGTGWARGNFNTDENTNFNDFVALSNNFGMNFASGSNVPEPAALGILAVAALTLVTRRVSRAEA